MSDNNTFEDDDLGLDDDGFDDFEKQETTLADLWRDNPLVKVGVIAGVVVLIFGTIIFMGGSEGDVAPSLVPTGNEVSAPPAEGPVSPAYKDQIEEQNEKRLEDALNQDGTFLPTPIDSPLDIINAPQDEIEEEDPLQRWRRLQEERMERELRNTQNLAPPPPQQQETGPNQAIVELSSLMAEQMQAILESQGPTPIQSIQITDPAYLEALAQQEEQEAQEQAEAQAAAAAAAAGDADGEKTLVPAGEILYAQLLTEANSDVPGPVLAQIMVGPLSGSRILGSFSESDSNAGDVLTLEFDTVVYKGESIGINGIALDPNTSLPGMATYVDHRYFRRIVIPAAVTFIQGAAEAAANTGLTTVTVNGEAVAEESEEADSDQEIASGVEEAAAEIAEILEEEQEDIEPLIIIDAGTPFGLLLLEPITTGGSDEDEDQEQGDLSPLELEALAQGL